MSSFADLRTAVNRVATAVKATGYFKDKFEELTFMKGMNARKYRRRLNSQFVDGKPEADKVTFYIAAILSGAVNN